MHTDGYIIAAVDFVVIRLAVCQGVALIKTLKLCAVVVAAVSKLAYFVLRYSAVAFGRFRLLEVAARAPTLAEYRAFYEIYRNASYTELVKL